MPAETIAGSNVLGQDHAWCLEGTARRPMCLELSKQGEQELRAGRDGAGPAGGVCGRWGRIGLLPPGRWERGGLWAEEGRSLTLVLTGALWLLCGEQLGFYSENAQLLTSACPGPQAVSRKPPCSLKGRSGDFPGAS